MAALAAAIVGALGALGGAKIGGRSAVDAAAVAGAHEHELSRMEVRRSAYADLGTAAFRFSRTARAIQAAIDPRFAGSSATWEPVDPALYEALDSTLDDVAHKAMLVQLHGPREIVGIAWDITLHCQRTERSLSDYVVTSRSGAEAARQRIDEALEGVSKARGVFLANGRAHLDGLLVPLEGEPYLRTLDRELEDGEE
ncbi:hypothetical protein ACFPH6_06885 [Streptomyces xiangluensis]|uniref:Secreted protein n=1 Tax=Streptomyces xiangluensis TaxID=2665720 RepID=A0ABV8YG58_9ACTN